MQQQHTGQLHLLLNMRGSNMGMFDTFISKSQQCPHEGCNRTVADWQSKNHVCDMNYYHEGESHPDDNGLSDIPLPKNAIYKGLGICHDEQYKDKHYVDCDIVITNGIFVGVKNIRPSE